MAHNAQEASQRSLASNHASETKMSLYDHLSELRYRILVSLTALIMSTITGFIFSRDIINLLKTPAAHDVHFIQVTPGEVFIVSLKVSLYTGIYLACPIILYHLIKFIAPGLKDQEKKYFLPISISSFIFFTVGAAFAYYVIVPFAINFLLSYGRDVAVNSISIGQFISFNLSLVFLTGIIFEIPIILVFLSLINLLTSAQLIGFWKYAIVISFVTGAIITPSPDPFGQSMVAGSLIILYCFSILMIRFIGK